MRPPLVVIAEPFGERGVRLLESHGLRVTSAVHRPRTELLILARDAEAVIVRSQTMVDGAFIRSCARLRVIGRAGAGVDAIHVDAATAAGVLVLNVPGGNTEAVAEHTIGLMLVLLRRVLDATAVVRSARWTRIGLVGNGLSGKALGIVGLGRVGSAVARRAQAFGMRLFAYDPLVTRARAAALGVDLVSLEELAAQADVLTVHVPLTPLTHHLIDRDLLQRMRPGMFLVNCARGGIVDEEALLDALRTGRVAAAALDVLAAEPPSEDYLRSALITHPRVVVTPHIGGSTHEALAQIAIALATDVVAALAGALPSSTVNPEAYARRRVG